MCTGVCDSVYKPVVCRIDEISDLTPHEKLFRVRVPSETEFAYLPGQFVLISVWGYGEAPISISNSPTRPGYLDFAVRNAGSLTGALHQLQPGDKIGVRGPYGSYFDVNALHKSDLLLIAGGCGLAPLRSLIQYCEDRRDEFGRIHVLYGAKTPNDLLYRSELDAWKQSDAFECSITVDATLPDCGYAGSVGLLPELIAPLEFDPDKTVAVIVGPPVMYRFVIERLKEKGLNENKIIVSLERYMKCGVGKCGHCAMDHLLCCTDGPVFNLGDLMEAGITL